MAPLGGGSRFYNSIRTLAMWGKPFGSEPVQGPLPFIEETHPMVESNNQQQCQMVTTR